MTLRVELRHHLRVMNDGAGDEMGEEADEEEVGERALRLGFALAEIDEVGDLREGEEGDAERKDDTAEVAREPADAVEEVQEREEVLEPEEQKQISGDGGDERGGFRALRCDACDDARGDEVEQDGGAEEEEIFRIPVAVEEE